MSLIIRWMIFLSLLLAFFINGWFIINKLNHLDWVTGEFFLIVLPAVMTEIGIFIYLIISAIILSVNDSDD